MTRVPRYDVIVVGGGAMGAAAAHVAAARGARVAMVEQFAPGHDRGSSHGPSRIFRLAYRERQYVPFAQHALQLWRELSEECGSSLLETTGGVDHGPAEVLHDIDAGLRSAGATSEWMTAAEATARWPGMRFDGPVLLQPDAGRVDADAAVAALHRCAAARGADTFYGEPVVALRPRDDAIEVVTGARTLLGAVAVVAAGAWLPKLLSSSPIAPHLPSLTVTQEQPAYFPCPGGDAWPVFVHHDTGSEGTVPHYGVFTPGLGVKVGEHGSGTVTDPDARPPADSHRLRRLSAYVEEWLPGADATPTRVDTCLYTTTPDETFVLQRFGRIVVCSACSGHGFKFVPAVGERTAALALDG